MKGLFLLTSEIPSAVGTLILLGIIILVVAVFLALYQ